MIQKNQIRYLSNKTIEIKLYTDETKYIPGCGNVLDCVEY